MTLMELYQQGLIFSGTCLPEWDFSVWLDESSEEVLGSPVFDSLESIFSRISGVEGVIQEDRELFYISAPSLTAQEIQHLILACLVKAVTGQEPV